MLALENIVRPRKPTILGNFILFQILYFHFDDLVSIYYINITPQIYHSSATAVCTWAEG